LTVFLDTETTGLSPSAGDTIVEVAIVGTDGRALLDTLVDPRRSIPNGASRVHGISDAEVRGKPTLADLMPEIKRIVSGEQVVIYNATFDTPFFPGHLREAQRIDCAMRRFSEAIGVSRWQKLDVAAQKVGHVWSGAAHRAKADALACRSVWNWLEQRLGRTSSTQKPPPPQAPRTIAAESRPPVSKISAAASTGPIWRPDSLPTGSADKSDAYCPRCIQRHRVPKGHVLEVRCIGCGEVFTAVG